jgi:DNA/RNA-binding domain of Phe-tRNA-synthetase-like protein
MWRVDPRVVEKYPGFCVGYGHVSGVTVEQFVDGLEEKKQQIFSELRSKYSGMEISQLPETVCYREFYKAVGADPSSSRVETLLQKVLEGSFPSTNNVVESCLLVSVQHMVIAGAYDLEKVSGTVTTMLAEKAEEFQLVDGRRVLTIPGEVVLRDENKVLAAFTSGDSRVAMVTPKTSGVLVVIWNAPGLGKERVEAAVRDALLYLRKYCGGHIEKSEVF